MKPVLVSLLALISTWLRSRRSMRREIVALRHQLGVYQRANRKPGIPARAGLSLATVPDALPLLQDRPAAGGVGFRCSKRTNTVGKCVNALQKLPRFWWRSHAKRFRRPSPAVNYMRQRSLSVQVAASRSHGTIGRRATTAPLSIHDNARSTLATPSGGCSTAICSANRFASRTRPCSVCSPR